MKIQILKIALCCLIVCSSCHIVLASPIQTFDYNGVRLDNSRLKSQLDHVKSEYLSIPNDDLLKGFRQRAGLAAPGFNMGGWYSNDYFHVFGQIISGLSRMYAATGDAACKAKVDYLIEEWEKTISPDGFFYYTNNPNARHYTYDKMVCGLVDAKLYCNNSRAVSCLNRITDWAIVNLDQTRVYAYNASNGNTEWYTLTENLYRAYLLTGDQKYKDFGDIWAYSEFWDIFANNGNIFDRWQAYHAYSHLNSVNGAGAEYLVKGQPQYLNTLVNAHDYWLTKETYASGGYGPREYLQGSYDNLISSLLGESHFETQCGSWAAFKLCKYLLTNTGDARFGDWVETLTYNGIGASIGLENGNVQYFSSYSIYGSSKKAINKWSCCTGTRPQAVADYADLIWFKDPSNLYVNLYTPSSVNWICDGKTVNVVQRGQLEANDEIEFTLSVSLPVTFGFKFRVPNWISGQPVVKINDVVVQANTNSNHWLEISRQWQTNDKVSIAFPMNLRTKRVDPSKIYPYAIMYGPIFLAAEPKGLNSLASINYNQLNLDFVPVSDRIGTFVRKNNPELILKPYYAYEAGEKYFAYIDPRMDDYSGFTFVGSWSGSGQFRYTNSTGSKIEGKFYGNYIKVEWSKFNDAGKAEIKIDGQVAGIIDQYGPCRGCENAVWTYCLPNGGEHTFSLRVLGQKCEESSNTYINMVSIAAKDYKADINCDEKIDIADLAIFYDTWLFDSTTIPEPVPIGTSFFNGSWSDGNFFNWSVKRTDQQDAFVGCAFNGTGTRLCGVGSKDGGLAEVWIDGSLIDTKDFYSSIDNTSLNFDFSGLQDGEHYIILKVMGSHNPSSTGNIVSFLRFEPLDPGPMIRTGSWNGGYSVVTEQPFWYSSSTNASISRSFTGTGIKLISTSWQDSGIAEIQIDGIVHTSLDLYQHNGVNGIPYEWEVTGLNNGTHTILVRVTGTKNPLSGGNSVNVVDLVPIK
ncbi:MAG: hypothetical protein A2Y10_05000 [Planctomycetes bacterium GWF2_41_51]|nr:MAG: hypothetical protein A2Y10_05000 [Planctomycetes bacterium GWF2_41_51]HBG25578.1 hypothetical protein [Phycisphaerales bacterium]